MKHFLVQENDALIHLPDCKIEIGLREVVEIPQIGGPPVFRQGRKQPDICVFTKPAGAQFGSNCRVVSEAGTLYSVLVTTTEIGAYRFLVAGVVQDTEDFSSNADGMNLIRQAVEATA